MKKVCIVGAAGRMGNVLVRHLQDGTVEGLVLGGALDQDGCPHLNEDASLLAGRKESGVLVTSDFASACSDSEVLIDFSFHTASAEHARLSAEHGKPIVIGTTGLSKDEEALLEEAGKSIPVVYAPNMSMGMNLLFSLVEKAAASLKGRGYDCEIIERHHRRKKDAPSGTALGLGRAAAAGLGVDLNKVAEHGRSGHTGERSSQEIGFHAVRAGDIVGDHTVVFAGEGECIELSHRATKRDTFAVGALRAADWITDQAPGVYSMQDMLGL
jgi:4-hydroxy-tetrahydrodipicolinate reductase